MWMSHGIRRQKRTVSFISGRFTNDSKPRLVIVLQYISLSCFKEWHPDRYPRPSSDTWMKTRIDVKWPERRQTTVLNFYKKQYGNDPQLFNKFLHISSSTIFWLAWTLPTQGKAPLLSCTASTHPLCPPKSQQSFYLIKKKFQRWCNLSYDFRFCLLWKPQMLKWCIGFSHLDSPVKPKLFDGWLCQKLKTSVCNLPTVVNF